MRSDCSQSQPGQDYLTNFQKGDPYTKIDEGYARLPGAGYEALHPEIEGINPEDYPDIDKLRILGDVAPYSREYQRYASIVRHQAEDNPDLKVEYERIAEQVRQTKESTLHVAQRHFNAPVDTIEGTVREATAGGVELEEFPGGSLSATVTRLGAAPPPHTKLPRAGAREEPALHPARREPRACTDRRALVPGRPSSTPYI